MIPIHTSISHFGCHVETTVEWKHALTALVAENGAGKTFLLEADFACLYGSFPSRAGSIYDHITTGETSGVIESVFEHDGCRYTARREVKDTGKTRSQKCELFRDNELIAGPKTTEFESVVASLLGDEKTALATWFSCQGGRGDLCSSLPSERREIFGQLLQFDKLQAIADKASEAAKGDAGELRGIESSLTSMRHMLLPAELATLEQSLTVCTDNIVLLTRREDDENEAVEKAEAELRSIDGEKMNALSNAMRVRQVWESDLGRLKDRVETTERSIESHNQRLDSMRPTDEERAIAERLEELREQFKDIAGKNAEIQKGNVAIDDKRRSLERELATAKATVDNLRRDLARLNETAAKKPVTPGTDEVCAPCPLLAQWADIPNRIKSAEDDIAAQEVAIARIESELAALPEHANLLDAGEFRADGERARYASGKIAAFDIEKAKTESLIRERDNAVAELQRHESEEPPVVSESEFDNLRRERDKAETRLAEVKALQAKARADVRAEENRKAGLEAEHKAMLEKMDECKKLTSRREELTLRTSRLARIAQAFGKRGGQALLIDSAAPALETIASQMLDKLTGGKIKLRFATQVANRDGSIREDFLILAKDARGERDVSTFSGGEKRLIQTVLRLAVSDWSSRLYGRRAGCLRIDEAMDALDASKKEAMIDMLESLSDRFVRVIVVTHDGAIAARIPGRVYLEKTFTGVRVTA